MGLEEFNTSEDKREDETVKEFLQRVPTPKRETVNLYRIPLERMNGRLQPAYEVDVEGKLYLYHYSGNHVVIIQEKGYGPFHKDSVAVGVEEIDKELVEQSDDRIQDFA